MKFRSIPSALVMAVVMLSALAAHAGETLQRVQRSGVMRDILVDSYPPFGFVDASNHYAGFDVDVAKAIAQRLGVKIELAAPSWEVVVGGHWNGRWDLCVCSMTPNTERARVLDFPVAYYASPAVLVVNKAETRIQSAKDLTGKKVGVGLGSSYENYLQKNLVIPNTPPIAFPFGAVQAIPSDETVAFGDLALGPGVRLDAVISDLATAKARINQTAAFKIVAQLYAEPNWIATDKGDPEWNEKIRTTLQSLRADGTLAKISQKWLGEDITKNLP